jgi:hypothetical protein
MPIPLFRAQLPLLGLKDLNKLDGVQSTGEGILPRQSGYKKRVVGGIIFSIFCRRVFLSGFWLVSFWFLFLSPGFFP